MSKLKSHALGLARLGIGVGIIAFLIHSINQSSMLATFTLDTSATVEPGAVYTDVTQESSAFIVTSATGAATELTALCGKSATRTLAASGTLARTQGTSPDRLTWIRVRVQPNGIHLIGQSFRDAGRNWVLLVLGLGMFLLCLAFCMVRWQLLLVAQGLRLPWKRTFSIFFIGHFFNAFMFGATGGDVVKAYYAARETGHRKAEAVSTVFIDRVVGLIALILLAGITMLCRLDFILGDVRTRYAFYFIMSLVGGLVGGFGAMILLNTFIRKSRLAQRAAATRIGHILLRVYGSFYQCLTRPSLLFKTLMLSFLNHLLLVGMMALLGRALLIDRPFTDYLSLGPTINSIGALPVTPGGLGLREYAAVVFLGIVGVPAARALPLSLMIYAAMLFWSLFGGIVFILHKSGTGKSIREELEEAESDDAEPPPSPDPRNG
jgi:hypothetical protein